MREPESRQGKHLSFKAMDAHEAGQVPPRGQGRQLAPQACRSALSEEKPARQLPVHGRHAAWLAQGARLEHGGADGLEPCPGGVLWGRTELGP